MPTITVPSQETTSTISGVAAHQLRWVLGHTLDTFASTPDDKLDFKPSETANSIRQLAIHILEGNMYIGGLIGIEGNPVEGLTDREALAARITSSTEAIIAKIEALTPELMGTTVEFFGHPMPMTAFVNLNYHHMSRHAGQIDYVQTIYGDMENHFGG